MRSKQKADFEGLVGRIQAAPDALQQDALVVINRSVMMRAWLTDYSIVECEQHGADRAKYGEGLLKKCFLHQLFRGEVSCSAFITYSEPCHTRNMV